MKLVLASRAKGPTNRKEAWACAMSNLALPGSGSLAAGKSIGYYQLGLAAAGFIIILLTGIHLLEWTMTNGTKLNQTPEDSLENFSALLRELRGPVLGLGIAVTAILWAGVTSLQILAAHPKNPVPPRIV